MTLHKWPVVTLVFLALVTVSLGERVAKTVDIKPSERQARRSTRPPVTVNLKENIWMFPAQLPEGKLIGISDRSVDGVHEVSASYSTDSGYSWTQAEPLFRL